jgi:hypothetical protein
MKTNTDDLDEMLNGEATYWIAGGSYDVKEERRTKDKARRMLIQRCLDPDDFVYNYFMDHVLLSKKREVLM